MPQIAIGWLIHKAFNHRVDDRWYSKPSPLFLPKKTWLFQAGFWDGENLEGTPDFRIFMLGYRILTYAVHPCHTNCRCFPSVFSICLFLLCPLALLCQFSLVLLFDMCQIMSIEAIRFSDFISVHKMSDCVSWACVNMSKHRLTFISVNVSGNKEYVSMSDNMSV